MPDIIHLVFIQQNAFDELLVHCGVNTTVGYLGILSRADLEQLQAVDPTLANQATRSAAANEDTYPLIHVDEDPPPDDGNLKTEDTVEMLFLPLIASE